MPLVVWLGDVIGDVTGDVNGDVTGDVAGDVNGDVTGDVGFDGGIGNGNWTGVYFNYISDEITRVFKPYCVLTTTLDSVNLISGCSMVGHRLEMRLIANLTKEVVYKLIMDDVPNPDFGYFF